MIFTNLRDTINSVVNGLITLRDFVISGLQDVLGIVRNVVETLGGRILDAINVFREGIASVGNTILSGINALISGIENVINSVVNALAPTLLAIGNILNNLLDTIIKLKDALIEFLTLKPDFQFILC